MTAGEELFALACKCDLEGIVAKYKFGPYLQDTAQWLKIRNLKYSQWAGPQKYVRWLRVVLAIYVPQGQSLLYRDLRTRRPGE